jgi:hypothetical protein
MHRFHADHVRDLRGERFDSALPAILLHFVEGLLSIRP